MDICAVYPCTYPRYFSSYFCIFHKCSNCDTEKYLNWNTCIDCKCHKCFEIRLNDSNYCFSHEYKTIKKQPATKRKAIAKNLRDNVWLQYMGPFFSGKCLCCGINPITFTQFHCGHVLSVNDGGENTIQNLRPICQSCNTTMGSINMLDFIKKCGYKVSRNWNGYVERNSLILPKIFFTFSAFSFLLLLFVLHNKFSAKKLV
jgi:5-methylcytosine-specific restriction endonuclease McrA